MEKENILKKLFTNKKLRYGATLFISIAVMLVVFVIINVAIPRLGIQWDLTPEGLYTLGDTSKEILSNLTDDIEIVGLMDNTKVSSASSFYNVIKFMEYYEFYDHITVNYIDPDTNIGYVSRLDPTGALGLTKQNFIVINKRTGNMKAIKYYDMFSTFVRSDTTFEITDTGSKVENAFTSAISYVTRESYTNVYFVTGHNEYSYMDGYIKARDAMELNGYNVSIFDLRSSMQIPQDADILLMINPTIDLLDDEIKLLEAFMKKEGSLMLTVGAAESNEEYPNLQKFLDYYNVQLNYDRVKEYKTDSYAASNQYYIFPAIVGSSSTLTTYRNITYLLTPNSRSVRILNKAKPFLEISPLLKTSSLAKQESTMSKYESASGMVYTGAEVKSLSTGARLLVLGSTDFMRDYILMNNKAYESDATKFFIGLVNWLEGDYTTTQIEEKSYFVNILSITASQASTVAVLLYILPALILIAGGIVYLKRRHL